MGKTAIVMSGGGAKGSFELGALDHLIGQQKIDPEVIVGVSTGTLNAAILAQGKGAAGLKKQLASLKRIWFALEEEQDIYYQRLTGYLGLLFKADSIYSNKPLWRLIKQHVSPQKLKNSGRVLRIGVVDLMSGDFEVIDGGDDRILEMIRASASIPVFFNPVDVGTQRLVDGGVRNITPLNAAFEALAEIPSAGKSRDPEPDTIYILLASPLQEKPIEDQNQLDSGIEILKRSLSLLTNEIYRNDLKMAALINAAVKDRQQLVSARKSQQPNFPYARYRYANLVLVQPRESYLGTLEFDPQKIKKAFAAGQAAAKQAVKAAKAAGGSNVDLAEL